MRARPREINIFNMSLLDILCGALGAFCFMMLVALPYYVVGKVDQAKSQQRTEELMKDIEKLRERMSDPAQAEDLRKLVDELEAQIKQLQGQLNQYAYENEQLQVRNQQLTDENTRLGSEVTVLRSENARLTNENNVLTNDNTRLTAENAQLQQQHREDEAALKMRKPFVVMAGATDVTQEVAIYLEDEKVWGTADKTKLANVHFEPRALVQPSTWQNDLSNISVERRGVTLWVSSTSFADSSYRVFVKYRRPPPEDVVPFGDRYLQATPVYLSLYGDFADDKRFFKVDLTPKQFWVFVGRLKIDDKGKLTFNEASDEERQAAWREFMKSDPPTPMPSATPGPTLNPEDMERIRRRTQEERQRLEEDRRRAEEIRRRMMEEERARRPQEGVTPAPSP